MSGVFTRAAYNLALCGGMLAASPFLAVHALTGRSRAIARARLGLGHQSKPPRAAPGAVWVHALSVGEVASALPLVKALMARLGEDRVVMSVSTAQGLATARQGLGGDRRVFVRTLDLPWLTSVVARRLRPGLFILVEGDVWPNLQWALARRGAPAMLVNGRISPRSAGRMAKLPGLGRVLYGGFAALAMQSAADMERIIALGVDQARVSAVGNLKYDSVAEPLEPDERQALTARFGLDGRTVLVAGSTHGGEEEACLQAYKSLAPDHPGLCLLLAPRNTQRGAEVEALAKRAGFQAARISRGAPDGGCRVMVLDEMGLLARAYGLARAAFVGGSLVAEGGHNPLEPAAQGVPLAMGPHMEDFSDMAPALEQAHAARTIHGAEGLTRFWREMLEDGRAAEAMGQAGREQARRNRGSLERTLQAALELYKENPHA